MDTRVSLKEIDSLDLLKFILSFFIIAYHSNIFIDINRTAYVITRMFSNTAVAFFFIISGYLVGRKMMLSPSNTRVDSSVLLSSLKRLAIMWLIWEIIYSPFMIYSIKTGNSVEHILIYRVLLGSYAHLWFLRASAVAVLVVWGLIKIRIPDKAIAIIALIFHLVGAYMLSIAHNAFFRNGLFFAFPYTVMGIVIANYQERLFLIKKRRLFLISAGVITSYIIEFILLLYVGVGQSTLMLPFVCALIVVFFLRSGMTVKNAVQLRHISTLNYTVHYAFFCILSPLIRVGEISLTSVGIFAGTMVCTLITSFSIIMLQKKIKVLKHLY